MGTDLAVAIVHPEGHAGGHEQEQRLLLRELLLQPLNGLAGLVRSLWGEAAWLHFHPGGQCDLLPLGLSPLS